jgi:hypothetical protein
MPDNSSRALQELNDALNTVRSSCTPEEYSKIIRAAADLSAHIQARRHAQPLRTTENHRRRRKRKHK